MSYRQIGRASGSAMRVVRKAGGRSVKGGFHGTPLCLMALLATASSLMTGRAGADPIHYAVNGHWYEAVEVPQGIPWETAVAQASARGYDGLPGHLATITSLG